MPDAAPRLIRRYSNRKLYDVRTSTYVALEDLAALVRAGETVQVVDQSTGDDITAQTLTQVILDEGRRGPSLLPTDLLHAALRRGGRALDDLVQQSVGRLSRVLPVARADELDALRRQLADLERRLSALAGAGDSARTGATPTGTPHAAPSGAGDAPTPPDTRTAP